MAILLSSNSTLWSKNMASDSGDFGLWKDKMQAIFTMEGVWEIVDGRFPLPDIACGCRDRVEEKRWYSSGNVKASNGRHPVTVNSGLYNLQGGVGCVGIEI
jgi:hypothetical protein